MRTYIVVYRIVEQCDDFKLNLLTLVLVRRPQAPVKMPLDTQNGKKKPLKAPKKSEKVLTEADIAFKQAQNAEKKKLEEARKAALLKMKGKK